MHPWLKSINDDLILCPTKFWECVHISEKNNYTMIQLHVGGICLDDPGDVAEAFAKHFYSTHTHTLSPPRPIRVSCSDFLLRI
jgi:hypothetical protein